MENFPENTESAQCAEIAKKIFMNDPKAPFTIRLGLEEVDHEYVFQIILNILLEGLYIKFGSNFDIGQLNVDILCHLNQYMNSMGFQLNKHADKEGHCYCDLIKLNNQGSEKYIFVVNKHQLVKNDMIERKNLTEYYINIGEAQLNFSFYYSALNDNVIRQDC
jgi:hypothetical protein